MKKLYKPRLTID